MRLVRVMSSYFVLILYIVCLTACPNEDTTPEPIPMSVASENPLPDISISPSDNFTILLGQLDTVSARVRVAAASTLRFRSSQPEIVSVDSITGVIRGVSLGTTTITATAGSTESKPSIDVTVLPTSVSMTAFEHRRMVSRTVGAVCLNEEESGFLDSLPDLDLKLIHEFHDCQRLIYKTQYQSLVGIYAHRNLTTYGGPEDYVEGKLAAIIVNFETKGQRVTYAPLGLAPGASCLMLKWTPGATPTAPGTWNAAIVHSSALPSGCTNTMNWTQVPVPQPVPLEVKMQLNGGAPNNTPNAPPVARWDWDSIHGVNYIGVRCGETGWCEIGPRKFSPRAPLKMANGKTMFKGYYDEQYLADQNGGLSDVFGTVSPGPDAMLLDRNTAWYKAAKIELTSPGTGSAAFAFYHGRLKLNSIPAPNKVRSEGMMSMMSPPLPSSATQNDRDWFVRVNGANPTPGRKMRHRGHQSEGRSRFMNVRWRWNAEDETVWAYCPEVGCCELGRLQ